MKTDVKELINGIVNGMETDTKYAKEKLEKFYENVGDNLNVFDVQDYYSGDIKVRVSSMDELAELFRVLMKAGYNKPHARGVEIGPSITTSSYLTDIIYIVLSVDSDNIPDELIGECCIEEVEIKEQIIPGKTKRVLVCNRDD